MDTISILQTEDSLEAIENLLSDGKLEPEELLKIFDSLSLFERPTPEMIDTLYSIFEIIIAPEAFKNTDKKTLLKLKIRGMLSISSIINRHCNSIANQNSGENICLRNPMIQSFGLRLQKLLGKGCEVKELIGVEERMHIWEKNNEKQVTFLFSKF